VFLRAHWPALRAADFFTTEVWTVRAWARHLPHLVLSAKDGPGADRSSAFQRAAGAVVGVSDSVDP